MSSLRFLTTLLRNFKNKCFISQHGFQVFSCYCNLALSKYFQKNQQDTLVSVENLSSAVLENLVKSKF